MKIDLQTCFGIKIVGLYYLFVCPSGCSRPSIVFYQSYILRNSFLLYTILPSWWINVCLHI